MTTPNPDRQRHVFKTFLGLPPDSDTPPVCGATLTSAYDGRNAPDCPTCLRILREHQQAVHRQTTAAGTDTRTEVR